MLGTPRASVYSGCIGNDENGKTLRTVTEAAGVETQYQVDESTVTGTCAVLITDKERYTIHTRSQCIYAYFRSLCTNLGAANNFKKTHMESPTMQKV